MSRFVLHSYRRCPFAIRVRMTLEEKGLPYEVKEEKLSALSPELLRLHPEGKVPLLIHDGVPIHESAVITEYIDEIAPNPPLRPKDALGRAQVRLWTHWCNQIFKPDVDLFKYKMDGLPPEEKEKLLARLRGHFQKMEVALEKQDHLMGSEMNLADIHIFPFYRQIEKCRADFHTLFSTDRLDAWLKRLMDRPSFERVMQKAPKNSSAPFS